MTRTRPPLEQQAARSAGGAAASQHQEITRYFAHRKEAPAELAVARTVISFPSTVVHTLPLVLADAALAVAC